MTGHRTFTDRRSLDLHRARSSHRPALFLHEAASDEISERLSEVNKTFIAPALVGHITPPLAALFPGSVAVEDSERLSLTPQSHDLMIHAFGLHWADDPVGQLVQSRLALKPDGLFLAVMFGGETLQELRAAISEAEIKTSGGLSPRILPMGELRDLGGLLQRAGFALPVADRMKLSVRYPTLTKLVADLRGMGETNALAQRNRTPASRALFRETEDLYRKHFSDEDGYLLATFELIFLTGWAPSKAQPRPLAPGSAQARLADALGVVENPDTSG